MKQSEELHKIKELLELNKRRLYHEINQSKELVNLIAKSTYEDLSDEEKKKVKDQLLDIFKSIPALAIFLLPGGAILLPFAVKYIPQLFPSIFTSDPRDDDQKM